MKAKKSHDLLSTGWKHRKAGGVTQPKSEVPRTSSSDVQGKERWTMQLN